MSHTHKYELMPVGIPREYEVLERESSRLNREFQKLLLKLSEIKSAKAKKDITLKMERVKGASDALEFACGKSVDLPA